MGHEADDTDWNELERYFTSREGDRVSFDNQLSVIKVRGRDFPIPSFPPEHNKVPRALTILFLSLYALEDPRVDAILEQLKAEFIWPGGKWSTKAYPTEPPQK